MSIATVLQNFIGRLPAFILAGMFLLMATGVTHACVDDHESTDKTEHVVMCECACHHHLQVPENGAIVLESHLSDRGNCPIDNDPFPDPESSGIFRPPKLLV